MTLPQASADVAEAVSRVSLSVPSRERPENQETRVAG